MFTIIINFKIQGVQLLLISLSDLISWVLHQIYTGKMHTKVYKIFLNIYTTVSKVSCCMLLILKHSKTSSVHRKYFLSTENFVHRKHYMSTGNITYPQKTLFRHRKHHMPGLPCPKWGPYNSMRNWRSKGMPLNWRHIFCLCHFAWSKSPLKTTT